MWFEKVVNFVRILLGVGQMGYGFLKGGIDAVVVVVVVVVVCLFFLFLFLEKNR